MLVIGIPVAEKAIRTVGVYLFLLVGLRLAGKRELGQFNPLDLVVLLLLSNTLQNAIIGNETSMTGGMLGAAILLAINWLVVHVLYDHPMLLRFVEGGGTVLIHRGHLHEDRLRLELISRDELEIAARKQGIHSLTDVRTCRLEVGGALTFVAKEPTEESKRHAVVMQRLEQLSASQAAILARLPESYA